MQLNPTRTLGIVLVSVGIVLFVGGLAVSQRWWATPVEDMAEHHSVQLGSRMVELEVVRTQADQEQGLSGRTGLAKDSGMLFAFETPGMRSFWMKDMLFDLDIVWVSDTSRVVGITYGATPATYPTMFNSPEAVKYVIEIGSGKANEYGLQAGQTLDLSNIPQ